MAALIFELESVLVKWLFIGDVTGKPGVAYVGSVLPGLIDHLKPDLVIANGENASPTGRGITPAAASALYDAGVEMITLGNHTWDQRDAYAIIDSDERIVRPLNYHASAPGQGYRLCRAGDHQVAIINVLGRTYLGLYDCPFAAVDRALEELRGVTKHVIVDVHAEVTSEKLALAWHLAGRVSAVVGTHTHVQTADERVLPGGTGYLTDVGMTGPYNGILGVRRETVIRRFIDQMPARFDVADGPRQFSAVAVDVDEAGRATAIERIFIHEN
ncbi:MAG: TIGR00282 family metallophosphoesterase [Sulfobacillus sp.]